MKVQLVTTKNDLSESQRKALISLLGDEDSTVYQTVREKLLSLRRAGRGLVASASRQQRSRFAPTRQRNRQIFWKAKRRHGVPRVLSESR